MSVSASLLAASLAVRAASLDLCSDEYLLLLARPSQLASLSRVGHDRADSLLWPRATTAAINRGHVEDLIGSGANLLVTMGGGGRSRGYIAKQLGLRVLDLPYPTSIDVVIGNVERVASALGSSRRAASWRAQLQVLRRTSPPSRDSIFLNGGGQSVSATSLAAQWMQLAGFRERPLTGGEVTLETLITAPPQRLLRSTYRRTQVSLGQRWLDQPAIQRLAKRTVFTDGRPWTCAGPLMVGEIARLRLTK